MFKITRKILLILLILLLVTAIILAGLGINNQQVKWWSITVFALLWLTLLAIGMLNEFFMWRYHLSITAVLILLALILFIVSGLHLIYAKDCSDCMHWSAIFGMIISIGVLSYALMLMRENNVITEIAPVPKVNPAETIFVSIASYRDKDCPQTVRSLFENAAIPENITVGICQQNAESDPDCYPEEWRNNIRIMRLNYMDALGPTYARYLCSTLWSGEKYYLQIDSHSLFAKNWDTKLIEMIKYLKAHGVRKPVLSHYPRMHSDYNTAENSGTVPMICKSFFTDDNIISFEAAKHMSIDKTNPMRATAYIAGGMLFAESVFLKEIPFDPNLPFLFQGEEILQSARFWTHGWDIFTPSENLIFHYYSRSGEPKIWTDNKQYNSTDAINKVKFLLNLDNKMNKIPKHLERNLEIYGLGKERSLADYFKFAGIDVAEKKVTRNFCE